MRRLVVTFSVLFLICVAANVALAYWASQAPSRRLTTVINTFGNEAQARGWPVSPPVPWPSIYQHQVEIAFAARVVGVSAGADANTAVHSMEYSEFGWPLPVLTHLQMWWPWDDPLWNTETPDDSGLRLSWIGLLFPPIVVAAALTGLVFGPLAIAGVVRKRRRRRQSRCVRCGYPIAGSACPECGHSSDAGSNSFQTDRLTRRSS